VTAKPNLLFAVMLFFLGAFIGSLAPVFSLVGSNQYLLKMLLQTWHTYLFAYGWWPWSLAGGVIGSLSYLFWPRKKDSD
jgi:hypothetical protein